MPPHTRDINRPRGRSLRPLRALIPFIRPYLGTVILAIGALLIASTAFLLTPIAVRYVIDFGFSSEDAANVDRYFFYLLGVVLLLGVFGGARAYFLTWLGERVVADVRSAVFRHVIRMDPSFFEVTKIGEVLSRLSFIFSSTQPLSIFSPIATSSLSWGSLASWS